MGNGTSNNTSNDPAGRIQAGYEQLDGDHRRLLHLVEFCQGCDKPEILSNWLKDAGFIMESGRGFTQAWCKEAIKTLAAQALLVKVPEDSICRLGLLPHPALVRQISAANQADPDMALLAREAGEHVMQDINSYRIWEEHLWLFKQLLLVHMALQTRRPKLLTRPLAQLYEYRTHSHRQYARCLPRRLLPLLVLLIPELAGQETLEPRLEELAGWLLDSRLEFVSSDLYLVAGEAEFLARVPLTGPCGPRLALLRDFGRLLAGQVGALLAEAEARAAVVPAGGAVLAAVNQSQELPLAWQARTLRCLALVLAGREAEARELLATLLLQQAEPWFAPGPLYAFLVLWSVIRCQAPLSKLQSWLREHPVRASWGTKVRALLRHRGKAEAWMNYCDEINNLPGEGNQDAFWSQVAALVLETPDTLDWAKQAGEARDVFLSSGSVWLAVELAVLLEQAGVGDAWPAGLAETRDRLGLVQTVTGCLGGVADWELKLAMLQALKLGGGKKTGPGESQEQICWLLDPTDTEAPEIQPVLRKIGRNGAWSSPKALSLRTLVKKGHLAAGPEDLAVLAHLHEGYYEPAFSQPAALVALAGHPRIFLAGAPDTAIKLSAADIALSSREVDGKIHLGLSQPLLAEGRLDQLDVTSFQVLKASPEIRKVAEVIGKGIAIPREGLAKVAQVLGSLAQALPVESRLLQDSANAEQRSADPRPVILLLPEGTGIAAHVHVRPLGDAGSLARPGQGTPHVHHAQAGRILVTQRDLAAEKAAQDRLLAACPTLDEWLLGELQAHVSDPVACLAILSELRDQGDRVVVEWPQGQKLKIRSRISTSNSGLRLARDHDWFQLDGSFALDDATTLGFQDLLALLPRAVGNFLPIGADEYLEIETQLHRQLAQIWRSGETRGKTVRLSPAALLVNDLLQDETVVGSADNTTREIRQRFLAAFDQTFPLPPGLTAELRPYQLDGYQWLSRMVQAGAGCCLADDMGLGKTVQTIALLSARRNDGPSLVVAPASVAPNWLAELQRFAADLEGSLVAGNDRETRLAQLDALGPGQVLVITYGLLLTMEDLLVNRDWNILVLDEAHALKNVQAKRTRTAGNLKARCRVALTGTPLQNHLGELWSLFDVLNPGLLGSNKQFRERFLVPVEEQNDESARQGLKSLLKPFMLRRTKNQVLTDLPPKTEIALSLELQDQEKAWYAALVLQAQDEMAAWEARLAEGRGNEQQVRIQMLAWLMKLRRACCHPSLSGGPAGLPSAKQEKLLELLEELQENQHRALVFSQFTDHLALVRARLDQAGIDYEYLDGATPIKERAERVRRFQSGVTPVFLISLGAGGTGLNLTGADYVIHLDPWWNPAVEDQASDRAHRIGQTRPVTVYRLIAAGTIEDRIVALHRRKRDLADALLEGTEAAARLDTRDLLELLGS